MLPGSWVRTGEKTGSMTPNPTASQGGRVFLYFPSVKEYDEFISQINFSFAVY